MFCKYLLELIRLDCRSIIKNFATQSFLEFINH